MPIIKYTIEISGINKKGEQVKITLYASNSDELCQNIEQILNKKSKNWIEKLLGLE